MSNEDPRWLDPTQQNAWRALVSVVTRLPAALDTQMQRDSDMTHFEYFVLALLSENPERRLRLNALAAEANASLSRLSHVVTRLEKRGWFDANRFRAVAVRTPCSPMPVTTPSSRRHRATSRRCAGSCSTASTTTRCARSRAWAPPWVEQIVGGSPAVSARREPPPHPAHDPPAPRHVAGRLRGTSRNGMFGSWLRSRGMPSTRSLMALRAISVVPPAMHHTCRIRWSTPRCATAPSASSQAAPLASVNS